MRSLILLMMLVTFHFSKACAQDVATEHTQLLNNIELISENLRQLQALENQIEMIKNQVEGLKSVANYQGNFTDVDALRNQLTDMTRQGAELSSQTQNLITQMRQEIGSLPSSGTMTDQQQAADQQVLTVLQNSLNRVSQLRQAYPQQTGTLNSLMVKNDQALGQTQALQASNELAAQNIAQTQSTQELLSEQISMQAAMMSKQLQEEKDEDDRMKQIFNAQDDGSRIFGTLG